jgi:hypothetical protein
VNCVGRRLQFERHAAVAEESERDADADVAYGQLVDSLEAEIAALKAGDGVTSKVGDVGDASDVVSIRPFVHVRLSQHAQGEDYDDDATYEAALKDYSAYELKEEMRSLHAMKPMTRNRLSTKYIMFSFEHSATQAQCHCWMGSQQLRVVTQYASKYSMVLLQFAQAFHDQL